MERIRLLAGGAVERPEPFQDDREEAAPFMAVLWRRRWTLVLSVGVAVLIAATYLLIAPSTYRSTARLLVDPAAAQIDGVAGGRAELFSENFVQTQVDALRSAPVLERAIRSLDLKNMKTFASVKGDPVNWLLNGSSLSVDGVKRSDTVIVSMEAPDPQEAAQIVNAVIDSHLREQSEQWQTTAGATLRALEHEKALVDAKRDVVLQQMNEHQRKLGVASFQDDDASTIRDRTAALAKSVAAAQLSIVELKSRKQAVEVALVDPASRSAFVSTELMKAREGGDREYDELRTLLVQSEIALAISKMTQSAGNRGILTHEARIKSLRDQLADKETRLAEAYLLQLNMNIGAAEAQHEALKAALGAQQKFAIELDELQKQSSAMADRIVQVSVNTVKDRPLPLRVSDPARVEPKPVKPQKKLILLGALLVGWVAGIGLVMLREQTDKRVRAPEEAISLVGGPVLAMVPRLTGKWSAAQRGQLVTLDSNSAAAEAYRAIRTALHLGARRESKTVLITSATSGDGKSTTASNLAIACAQAGERTLLVDCDLRRPVQDTIFDVNGSGGITGVLAGQCRLGEAIRSAATENLYVLPCGALPTDPSAQLAGKAFTRLMQRLAATFDRVIIDSPPVMTVTDAHILAANADVTLLVLRLNRSTRDLVRHSCDALERVGATLLGVVANDVPSAIANHYYGGLGPYPSSERRKALLPPEPKAATDVPPTVGSAQRTPLDDMDDEGLEHPMPWETRVSQ